MSDITQDQPETVSSQTVPEKNKLSIGGIIMWAVIIGLLGMLGWGLLNSTAPRPEVGQPAPDFDMEFFNGYEWEGKSTAKLSDMTGKVVVINFWASWCVECKVEGDDIEQSWRKYAADDVVFLGIAYADVEPKSIEYMKEFDITYPNAPDLGTDIADSYEITGVPETFIIDQTGEIAHVQIGPVNDATLDSIISQLLAEGG